MSFDPERLYALLPAIHRIRDAEQGGPLHALLSAIAEQLAVLEEDTAQLYDDQFIETCAEWVVPYLGDLIGARALYPSGKTFRSPRAQVANTLAYRRRKGTAAVLEDLAAKVTGLKAHKVEFFQRLAATQHLDHLRLGCLQTPDLRRVERLESLDGPFDELSHTADMRSIADGRGRYNIPNVGLFLWRLRAHKLAGSPAVKVDARRWMMSPLGNDTQLYNRPRTESDVAQISTALDVPIPLGRRLLDRKLNAIYGRSFSLTVDGTPIAAANVESCDLSDVTKPDSTTGWDHMPASKIAVDPVLGRVALPQPAGEVIVTYHYGFSADIGGGTYDRAASIEEAEPRVVVPSPDKLADSLAAVAAGGAAEISDSGRYEGTFAIAATAQKRVFFRAADGVRPTLVLTGDLAITGGEDSEVTLDGLLITGAALRVTGKVRLLRIRHCTLVPGLSLATDGAPESSIEPSLIVESPDTRVEIERSILGAIRAHPDAVVDIASSIVDATDEQGTAYSAEGGASGGAPLTLRECTVIGGVHARVLALVSNSILLAGPNGVRADRLQEGCVRFSHLPLDARVPGRHRCQPVSGDEPPAVPQFTSLRYGKAGYCQLARGTPDVIRRGADDESEMGVFHDLYLPQGEANLRTTFDEYLRLGLEAGIFHAS
jgi:hypothetical protein